MAALTHGCARVATFTLGDDHRRGIEIALAGANSRTGMRGEGGIYGSAAVDLTVIGEIPVCRKIALFLLRNSEAADTARGIADWWIHEDFEATQMALDRLLEAGVLRVRSKGGMNFYSLSGNRKLRRSLRKMLRQSARDGQSRSKAMTGRGPAHAG